MRAASLEGRDDVPQSAEALVDGLGLFEVLTSHLEEGVHISKVGGNK